ncbi:hypothetical protein D9M68_601020 [compost metagenome]
MANTATLDLMVASDPRDLSKMTYSNNQFRHKAVFYASTPSIKGFSAGIRFSGIGGTRYSLAVSGNMNGDFVSSNDLAYVYDPNSPSTPQYLKDGINAILNNPDAEQSVKDYIRKSFGQIAERNGGINGFYGVFDLRVAKRFNINRQHGIELTLDIFNVANMLNKDWAVKRDLGKQNIYTIKNFNPTAQNYTYNVRTTTGVSSYSGTPFQCQLGLRYSF